MIRTVAAFLALGLAVLALPAADAPPKPLKPTPVPVNTDKDESHPNTSSDDLTLYYTVIGKDKAEVYVSQRKKAAQPCGPGKPLTDLKTKTASNRGVFVTPDGKFPQYLFFASDEDFEKKGQ